MGRCSAVGGHSAGTPLGVDKGFVAYNLLTPPAVFFRRASISFEGSILECWKERTES